MGKTKMTHEERDEGRYSPDYYICVEELEQQGMDRDEAEAVCEVIYG